MFETILSGFLIYLGYHSIGRMWLTEWIKLDATQQKVLDMGHLKIGRFSWNVLYSFWPIILVAIYQNAVVNWLVNLFSRIFK